MGNAGAARVNRFSPTANKLPTLFVLGIVLVATIIGTSSAWGIDWSNFLGSYADSNAITIPAVPAGPTDAEGWQRYD